MQDSFLVNLRDFVRPVEHGIRRDACFSRAGVQVGNSLG